MKSIKLANSFIFSKIWVNETRLFNDYVCCYASYYCAWECAYGDICMASKYYRGEFSKRKTL